LCGHLATRGALPYPLFLAKKRFDRDAFDRLEVSK
jgi:hypothetical protein